MTMKTVTNQVINVPVLILLAALVAVLAYQAGAERPREAMQRSVATIDLQRALEGLEQRAQAEMELQSMRERIMREREERERRIEEIQRNLRQLAEQVDAGDATLEQVHEQEERFMRERLRYQSWLQVASDELDVEQALLMQDLYHAIRKAAERMAEQEGYDLVLINDATREFRVNPDNPRSRRAQVEQQMQMRTVLVARGGTDITDNLVQRMNNEFRAAQ